MKRLTEYTIPETGFSVVSEEKHKRIMMEEKPSVEKVYNRLKKVEDILGDEYDLNLVQRLIQAYKEGRYIIMKEPEQAGVSRLRELAQADREGRCVILPDPAKTPVLKTGAPVWYVDNENGEIEPGKVFIASYKDGKLDSFSVNFDCGDFDEFMGSAWGNCFFGSEKQAEAALRMEQDG